MNTKLLQQHQDVVERREKLLDTLRLIDRRFLGERYSNTRRDLARTIEGVPHEDLMWALEQLDTNSAARILWQLSLWVLGDKEMTIRGKR